MSKIQVISNMFYTRANNQAYNFCCLIQTGSTNYFTSNSVFSFHSVRNTSFYRIFHFFYTNIWFHRTKHFLGCFPNQNPIRKSIFQFRIWPYFKLEVQQREERKNHFFIVTQFKNNFFKFWFYIHLPHQLPSKRTCNLNYVTKIVETLNLKVIFDTETNIKYFIW